MNPFKAKPKRRTADATPPTVASLEDYEIATNTVSKTIYQRVGSTIVAIANYFDASGVLAAVLTGLSTVTNAAITSADTVLSALGKLQAQINSASGAMAGKVNTSSINQPNGVAGLDASAKLNPSTLPALAITDTFPVASEAAMLALTCDVGDVAIRSDINKTFILRASPPSMLANWNEMLTPTAAVSSVFGRTGAVTAQANDYTFAQLGSKPTTASGYGITDAVTTNTTQTGIAAKGFESGTYVQTSGSSRILFRNRGDNVSWIDAVNGDNTAFAPMRLGGTDLLFNAETVWRSGNFDPNSKASLDASVSFANVKAHSGSGHGYIQTFGGSGATPGYVAFFSGDNTRRGYLGWSSGANIVLQCENGWGFQINGTTYANGTLTATAVSLANGAGAYFTGNTAGTQHNGSFYQNGTFYKLSADGSEWLPDLRTKVLSAASYAALGTKDGNTLYLVY